MGRLIYRQLRLDSVRTALTSVALAAVVAVILVLEGFNEGLITQLGRAVTDRGADLIVTQSGVSNLTATRSVLPQFARRDVEAVAGVVAAHPLTGLPVIYAEGAQRTPIMLMVYDTAGGPREVITGQLPAEPREMVVDRSLAKKHNLAVGDALVISDFEFTISGIADGAAAFFTPFGFARYDDLIDFYFESDVAADISTFPLLSFLLVELSPGADRVAVAAAIEANVPAGDVFLPEALAAEDKGLGRVLFGPVLKLLIAVGYIDCDDLARHRREDRAVCCGGVAALCARFRSEVVRLVFVRLNPNSLLAPVSLAGILNAGFVQIDRFGQPINGQTNLAVRRGIEAETKH